MPKTTSAGSSNHWETPEADEQLPPVDEHVDTPEPEGEEAGFEENVDQNTPAAAEIRAWARDNGIEVNARGAIPAAVVDQYHAAQKDE